jgi:hypothetical protein
VLEHYVVYRIHSIQSENQATGGDSNTFGNPSKVLGFMN